MWVVRGLVARHRDYVLFDWAPTGNREYAQSWVPMENISVAPGSNAMTSNPNWFLSLPEMQAAQAALFDGLGP